MHDNPGDRRVDNLCRLQHKCGPSVGISCNFRKTDQCETWYVTESPVCVCVCVPERTVQMVCLFVKTVI